MVFMLLLGRYVDVFGDEDGNEGTLNNLAEWWNMVLGFYREKRHVNMGMVRIYECFLHGRLNFYERWELEDCFDAAKENNPSDSRLLADCFRGLRLYLAVIHEHEDSQFLNLLSGWSWWNKVVWWTEITPAPESMGRSMNHVELLARLTRGQVDEGKAWSIVVLT